MVGDEATVTKELGRLADAGTTEFVASIIGNRDERAETRRAAEVDDLSDEAHHTRWPKTGGSPLDLLEALTVQEVEIAPDLRHLEIYTMRGLLTLLWHGPVDATDVLVTCGGGMGSLLGPAEGLYHDLGVALAARGIGTVRVGYRKPNDLPRCVHDVAAAADLAGRRGARRFVVMGHSFGGAVASG